MLILETCNISASMDIKGTEDDLNAPDLSSFPGENISVFVTVVLKLLKIMNGRYFLPLPTGLNILRKTKQNPPSILIGPYLLIWILSIAWKINML